MGTGVIFLRSDPNELVYRHQILFEALQAGNTGVFNAITAINDNPYPLQRMIKIACINKTQKYLLSYDIFITLKSQENTEVTS